MRVWVKSHSKFNGDKMKKFLAGCILALLSYKSNAGYEGGAYKVQSLRIYGGVTMVRFSPALKGCGGGDQYRMHAKISNENTALVSSLLTAYTAQKSLLYVFYEGDDKACSSSHILTLTSIEFTHQ